MRQLCVLLLALAVSVASASSAASYRGYRLVHANPRNEADAAAVQALSTWSGVDLWHRRVVRGGRATLMVAPGTQKQVLQRLAELGVPHDISGDDVQSMVDREATEQALARTRGSVSAEGGVRFDTFMRHDEVEAYINNVTSRHYVASRMDIGKTQEGRSLTVVRVAKSRTKKAKRAIIVDAGIHAREWIAPATALYLLDQLVENTQTHKDLLDGLDWYILPVVNPDGYEYSHTKDRFWRKNRGARSSWWGWILDKLCPSGTDLNRNFGFHWAETGTSSYPCSDIYPGSAAFSEFESQHLRDFILGLNADQSVKMYLTLHSYGPMILYPYGYSSSAPRPSDVAELESIAKEANDAIVKAGSEPFTVMNSAGLYPAAGASDDWVKGLGGIDKSFTLELHGGGSQGFDIPASRILESASQTFEGIKVFAQHAKKL